MLSTPCTRSLSVERVDDVVVVVSAEDAYVDEVAVHFPAKARVLKVGRHPRRDRPKRDRRGGLACGRLGARS